MKEIPFEQLVLRFLLMELDGMSLNTAIVKKFLSGAAAIGTRGLNEIRVQEQSGVLSKVRRSTYE